ncbi:NHA1 [Cyberlindnera jadinii]|uniref:NHA1 protein n=1 Tax=Cyberlindnera jadinii (strain ATCC 18201 / CBS 1600 / BCRC 20928 / JCM 3617 / NBRC 0987 / NRRL Y-1542) TaxID=983966 RepID=A0A0H5C1Z1_CYBJN|nr:NHA1 [Cyberlindnera jadinii]
MAVWEHLDVDHAHVAYAIIGTFSAVFSLVSLFVKEKLYIGEATVAAIAGLIFGPYCLNWFTPTEWGNTDQITLEISRIVLCLQIFAVAVELPKKYMLRHWVSVFMLLVPVMTYGWLVIGAFIYLLFPGLNFSSSLVVSACITATDPVLAAAVVGKGKFARTRVPGHLRNLLSAESGCNDGMAFPFIYLGVNLVIHHGNAREIVKDWICVTILYECILGCFMGALIGYLSRHAIKFCERKKLIDRESFLAFYIFIAVMCGGFGSILGVDDLLVSFAAGAAFSWDGWFARKTEESHVSTVIDLLLNLAYFVYFGAIVPWPQFNDASLGLNVWRLIVLAIVVLTLRRIPAVMAVKVLIPDIKTWREAIFCGHFGPIGVGAVYAAIVSRAALEGELTSQATPTSELPSPDSENYLLIAVIWPIVTFLIISSIIVHGSSVAAIVLGKHLNTMNITMSFTTTNGNSSNWMSRLPELKANGRSFSLHRIDTFAPKSSGDAGPLSQTTTVETSGIPARPAGGMRIKKAKKRFGKKKLKRTISEDSADLDMDREKIMKEREAKAAAFALGSQRPAEKEEEENEYNSSTKIGITPANTDVETVPFPSAEPQYPIHEADEHTEGVNVGTYNIKRTPTNAYQEGNTLIVEDQHGEIMDTAHMVNDDLGDRLRRTLSAASSGNSLLSPVKSLAHSLERIPSRDRPSKRYVAYKTGDHLIIESEDGEVLRRYAVHHHGQNDVRPRTTSLIGGVAGKALSVVGLKSSNTNDSKVPTAQKVIPLSPLPLEQDHSESEEEEESSVELETTDTNTQGEGEEEETAFERQRRLAALGHISTQHESEDEEEDVPPITPVSVHRGGTVHSITHALMPHIGSSSNSSPSKGTTQGATVQFTDTPKPKKH